MIDTTAGSTVGAGLGVRDAEVLGKECVAGAVVDDRPPDPPPEPESLALEPGVAALSVPLGVGAEGLTDVVTVVTPCALGFEDDDEQPAAAKNRASAGSVDAPIRNGRRRCTVVPPRVVAAGKPGPPAR